MNFIGCMFVLLFTVAANASPMYYRTVPGYSYVRYYPIYRTMVRAPPFFEAPVRKYYGINSAKSSVHLQSPVKAFQIHQQQVTNIGKLHAPVNAVQSPIQPPVQASVKTVQSPVQVPVETTVIAVQSPVQVPVEMPVQVPVEGHIKAVQSPVQVSTVTLVKAPVQQYVVGNGEVQSEEARSLNLPSGSDDIMPYKINTEFRCLGRPDGYYSDLTNDCRIFHNCVTKDDYGLLKYSFICPASTKFDQEKQACIEEFRVDCGQQQTLVHHEMINQKSI